MQIKTMDGVMRLVSQVELLKAYRSTVHDLLWDYKLQLTHLMKKKACLYMLKAATNIRRISKIQTLPTTLDDVKTALAHVIKHGNSFLIADAMYLAMLFLAARFAKHIFSK